MTARTVTTADLSGILPVLAMPFAADGAVHLDDLGRETDWAIDCGVDGLVLGRASEISRLSEPERVEVIARVAGAAAGRVPLVVLASGESNRAIQTIATAATENGAAALLVSPPTFEVGGDAAIEAFFTELLEGTGLAIVLQDIPEARVSPRLAAGLAAHYTDRVSLKVEVPPTANAIAAAIAATGGVVPVIGGAAGLSFLSELDRGSLGTMPGCVCPELFVTIWGRHRAGDTAVARAAFHRLLPLLVATSQPTRILAFYREALVMRGIFSSTTARAPTATLDEVERRELRQFLMDLDLLSAG